MSQTFQFDVLLLGSSRDVDFCRQLAARLRASGLRVWAEGPTADNTGGPPCPPLDAARTLVLVLSSHLLRHEWAALEQLIFPFVDPAEVKRQVVPLLREECPLPPAIRRYRPLLWQGGPEGSY